jgi:hypothetical protein
MTAHNVVPTPFHGTPAGKASQYPSLPEGQIEPFNMTCFAAFLSDRKMTALRKNSFIGWP